MRRFKIKKTGCTISSLLFLLLLGVSLAVWPGSVRAEYYCPSDSVPLTVGTVSISSDSIQDCDSIRIRWWWSNDGWTYVGTKKLTSSVQTGFYAVNIKASDGSDHIGNYVAQATAYKFSGSHTDVKTWSWTVVDIFDSLANAITNVNKSNFKADLSNVLDRADSSLYMRTDWNNVKNQDVVVCLSQTSMAHVDTVDTVTATVSASCDTESIGRSTWNEDIVPRSGKRIQYADSLGEEISASVDTSEILTMNENHQWGGSSIWNFPVRTLTQGAGSGVFGVVVRCQDSSDSAAVAFAQIQVLDSTENTTLAVLTSDSQGRGFFALDEGTYCVRLYKPGWQFTVPETLKVQQDEDTVYFAEAFDPGFPPQAGLCRVFGWVHDLKDQPMTEATVEAEIKRLPIRYQNLVISPYYRSTVTDHEGFWYLDLYPNSVLSPSGTMYRFRIFSSPGTILGLEVQVPEQASWELQW
jgi:hypothetical protein